MSSVRKKAASVEVLLPYRWVAVEIEAVCCLFVGLTSIDRKGMTEACRESWGWRHQGNSQDELKGNDDQGDKQSVDNAFVSEENTDHDGSYLGLSSFFSLI